MAVQGGDGTFYDYDPATGGWTKVAGSVDAPPIGTTLHNSGPTAQPEFATPQGGQVVPRGSYGPSPSSSTGAAAPTYSTPSQSVTGPAGQQLTTSRPITTPPSSSTEGVPWGRAVSGAAARLFPELNPYVAAATTAGAVMAPQPAETGELQPQFWPKPNTTIGTQTGPGRAPTGPAPFYNPPVPLAGGGSGPATPIPPQQGPGGPNPNFPPNAPIPPFIPRAAIPPLPIGHPAANAPSIQRAPPPAGPLATPQAGVPQIGVPAPQALNPGHYRATIGNARGNPTWVPGGEDAPAPQIYRGPLTMFGAGPQGAPRGAQNYYTPGSAPMAPGDWTGTGAPAGPFTPPAAPGQIPGSAPAQVPPQGGGGFQVSGPGVGAINQGLAYTGQGFQGGRGGGGNTPMPGQGVGPGSTFPPMPASPFGPNVRDLPPGQGAPPGGWRTPPLNPNTIASAPPPPPPQRPGGFGFNPLNFFGQGP